ncbi:protein NLRC3-like [Xyrauchen texanus]|uniref:protein NLRC3-like n=1 Tax=Xyrauchen texanus TaxID=154827 RepID=UPI002241C8C6|nr:protein NLRC3-like [Xyrauchen texanus]
MDSTKDLSGQTDTGKVKRIHKPCRSAAGNQDDEAHSSAKRQSVRRCDVHEDTVGEQKVLRRKVLQLACAYEQQCVIHGESPESSCVSMKSDRSMDHPPRFSSGAPCADVSVIHGESPESSCVSMKSDRSMDPPPGFSSGAPCADVSQLHMKRSDSPEPSCVSMKSDWSMDKPIELKGEHTPTGLSQLHMKRSDSPEPSCVSMKSDTSMDKPIELKGEHTSTGLSHSQHVEVQNTFKSNLLKKFQCLCEGTAKQENPTLLNEIYTELYITESERGEINNEHEVRQIEKQSRRATTEDTPIKCNDIFKALPGQDKPIRTVLTKGVAGIGKTVSVQKFIVDWAEGKANQDIHIIFPLPFRELNLMKDKKLSLSDLLQVFFSETKEMEISRDEYKVFFIFDGLDECRLSLDFQSNVRLCDVTESASVDVLLTNLIKGNLLPSSLIWITSRPAAAELIPSKCVDRVTEVRGFNDPQKEEYFRKRIRDQRLANRIITHLKSSRSLFIMCHIPVFCWISATVLERLLSKAERGQIPKTLTQMYTHFLIIQTNIKHEKDYEIKSKNRDMILKLGKLAFKQLVKGNLIFYEEDLRKCDIDVTEASVYSGLCTQIFREEFGLYQGKVFCFVHLSIQEHLAALYVHLSFTNNNMNVFEQITKQKLFSKVLKLMKQNSSKQVSMFDLHQTAVNETLRSKNGHLDLFLRFFLGLSLESNHTLLQELPTQTGSCSYHKEETVKYIKMKIRENHSSEKSINLFHCLNELGDDSIVMEIQHYLKYGKIKETKLSSSQWSAAVFVLMTSEQEMDEFDLNQFIGAHNKADEVLRYLLPVIKESRSVHLMGCNLTEKSCSALASILSSNSSSLRELNLSNNDLQDSGLKLLSDALKSPHCTLEILSLMGCNLTEKSCSALASILRSNSSNLIELDLSNNDLQDSGVKLLSDALKSPHCILEILRLSGCMVTEEGCCSVALALRSNPSCLKELDLSYNHPGESGVRLLSESLIDPNCTLDKLNVDHGGEFRITAGPRKWVCDLTLDSNTVNTELILSEGNRKVTRVRERQSYPDHPERFDEYHQVLCRESLTGRCYWETQWSEVGADISVSYKEISRKGVSRDCVFGLNVNSWSLECFNNTFTVWHNKNRTDIRPPSHDCKRVGVYVDCPAGTLSFYSVSDTHTLTHLHTLITTFTRPLYAGFGVDYSGSSVCVCEIDHQRHTHVTG